MWVSSGISFELRWRGVQRTDRLSCKSQPERAEPATLASRGVNAERFSWSFHSEQWGSPESAVMCSDSQWRYLHFHIKVSMRRIDLRRNQSSSWSLLVFYSSIHLSVSPSRHISTYQRVFSVTNWNPLNFSLMLPFCAGDPADVAGVNTGMP